MSNLEHTPTPWMLDEVRTSCGRAFRIGTGEMLTAGKGCCIIYDDFPGNPNNERSANAAFIVKAVNNHERLRLTLTRLERYVALNCYDKWLKDGHEKSPELSNLLDDVRFLLTQIEGA